MYKCKSCGRQFLGGQRRDKSQVITDYVEGKRTIEQLAEKYGVNEKTICRDLEGMRYVHKIAKYKQVTIQMDTTYWGRNFGIEHRPRYTPNPFHSDNFYYNEKDDYFVCPMGQHMTRPNRKRLCK